MEDARLFFTRQIRANVKLLFIMPVFYDRLVDNKVIQTYSGTCKHCIGSCKLSDE